MSRTLRFFSGVLVVMLLMTILGSTALAASFSAKGVAKVKYYILTVQTGKSLTTGKVTFGFSKGYGNDVETGKIKSIYGDYTAKVYDSNGKLVKTQSNYCGSSLTISGLKRNSTYKVYLYMPTAPATTLGPYCIKTWSVYPQWYIKSTHNVSSLWISGRSMN